MARKKAEKKVGVDAVRKEVVDAMRSQSPSDRERRVITLWNRWQEAKAWLKKTSLSCSDEVKLCTANLEEKMAIGLPGTGEQSTIDLAAKSKLFDIEVAWQDLEEAKAKRKDAVGGARDAVKGTFEGLAEAVVATSQIEMEYDKKEDEASTGDEENTNSDDESTEEE